MTTQDDGDELDINNVHDHINDMLDALRAVEERLCAGHPMPEGMPPLTPASDAAHHWVDGHLPHLPPRPTPGDQAQSAD
ncbi:hypothetical protein [Kitasatospora sp. NPDC058478]|uniref:hypothetical protein n=1 Tax=unclassified Kitasatospora TaxID=2633591 RepID=UPI0036509304